MSPGGDPKEARISGLGLLGKTYPAAWSGRREAACCGPRASGARGHTYRAACLLETARGTSCSRRCIERFRQPANISASGRRPRADRCIHHGRRPLCPSANKPTPSELSACQPYLLREIELLTELRAVICLGKIAFDHYLAALRKAGHTIPRLEFGHARVHDLGSDLPALIASYHPSRQNTNTGRLTKPMFDAVFDLARKSIDR